MSVNILESRVFIDTNVLVNVFDGRNSVKQKRANDVVRSLLANGRGAVSTQVIQEFCNVALKPVAPLKPQDLSNILREILGPMLVHTPSMAFYERALFLCQSKQLSYYDALIIQAAIDADCRELYSEDLQDGQQFEVLKVVNPFKN